MRAAAAGQIPQIWRMPGNTAAAAALTAMAAVVTGLGLAISPYLVMGAVVGGMLLVFALMKPVALVTLMLVIGPADLSVLTGRMFTDLGGLDMNGIRLIAMTFALSLVVLADRRAGREALRPTAVFYLALLAYGGLTLAFTPAPIDGSRLLLKIAYPLLVFLVVAGLVRTRVGLDRLMDVVLVGTVILCVVVNPLYIAFGDFEREIGGWVRLRGVGTHQNPFAFYLLAALLMSVVRFATRRQARYLVLSAICSFWMVLTISRIAFGAAVVSLLAVGLVGAVIARQTRILIGAVVVAALLAIPFAPLVLERTLGFVPTAGELAAMLSDPRALYSMVNWEGRQLFWVIVFDAFRSSPVFGLGLGASSFLLTVQFPFFQNPVVHNDYLRLLSDTGLVGVTLFTCAIGSWLMLSIRGARIAQRTIREYALPAIGCIAALAIIGITDNAFDYYGPFTQYIGFLCGGVVAGRRLIAAEQDNETTAHAGAGE